MAKDGKYSVIIPYLCRRVELPRASHTKVKTAEYVGSATKLASCPKPKLPEFAVIGRSNVGKSSLINMLTGRSSLALTSKTPGVSIIPNACMWPQMQQSLMKVDIDSSLASCLC